MSPFAVNVKTPCAPDWRVGGECRGALAGGLEGATGLGYQIPIDGSQGPKGNLLTTCQCVCVCEIEQHGQPINIDIYIYV